MPYSSLSQHADARFPDGLADVRGYEVRTRLDDEKVGKVADIVCDADGSIRYLDVDAGGFFNTKRVLLPIGAAQVDARDEVVWLSGMSKEQVKALPDFTGDLRDLDDDYDTRTRSLYGADLSDADLRDQGRFYADRGPGDARERRLVLSEERLDIQKRQVQAGEVSVRKHVETEHVRETVPVTHEEVTVERRPISADDARVARGTGDADLGRADRAGADLGNEEIHVPVMKEEVVANRRVVPTEEVVVRTKAVTEDRVVEEDLRRERVDVDDRQRVAGVDRALDRTADRDVGGIGDDRTFDRTTDRSLADRADHDGRTDVDDRVGGATRRAGRRVANAADDLKDRVDGDPASRPGPDATDRQDRF